MIFYRANFNKFNYNIFIYFYWCNEKIRKKYSNFFLFSGQFHNFFFFYEQLCDFLPFFNFSIFPFFFRSNLILIQNLIFNYLILEVPEHLYYVCLSVFLSVCVCVCSSVCPDSGQRTSNWRRQGCKIEISVFRTFSIIRFMFVPEWKVSTCNSVWREFQSKFHSCFFHFFLSLVHFLFDIIS